MSLETRPIRFLRRGRIVELDAVPPTRTLLDWLREPGPAGAGCTGTKEGCGEGDCGACTVALGELEGGRLRWRPVNSCIRFLASIDGCALVTVDDLRAEDGDLHPVQQAMVDAHASQCGFCTPGFVMTMYALYEERLAQRAPGAPPEALTREQAQQALAGNLCRCTGYRPILDAAQRMLTLPPRGADEAAIRRQLASIAPSRGARFASPDGDTWRPHTVDELLAVRAAQPQAQIVAGCTDVGLWVNKQHARFSGVLDLSSVQELRSIEQTEAATVIGASARLADAYDALVARRPQLRAFADRFAGPPVRNSGTLGGNLANGSPIGDSMPLLIALGATVRLAGVDGTRELALERLYTGYRKNAIGPREVLTHAVVPAPAAGELMRAYKLSKRFDDDISAVCLAISLQLADGRVAAVRIGVGGMAATPMRAARTEAALAGAPWSEQTVRAAAQVLRDEFSPIDDMRASARYRREAIGNLLWRLWHDSQGRHWNLERLRAEDIDPALGN
jgi:xanthine dehydrogenase small subunit